MSWGVDELIGWGNLEPSWLVTLIDFDEIFSMYKTYLNLQKGFLNFHHRLRKKSLKNDFYYFFRYSIFFI